ncbi:CLUMA_CG005036, isoform A [Clunio marinus]|uniref:CLUMA_CG005036, isoform A n=1 Tax=Clunio marinus TaxID=568069 RepID=A0A1J1HTP4_9DIPT|nr:CLUMA_CG005036, isoform A [Clunio marinus]
MIITKSIFLLAIAVSSVMSAVTINCDFHFQVNSWNILSDSYSCRGTVIRNDTNHAVIGVSGNHRAGLNNTHVETLLLTRQSLTNWLSDVENFFPNLLAIDFSYSSITTLTADNLKPFPNLKVLVIMYNKIEVLDSNTFQYTIELQHLGLAINEIREVGSGILDELADLKLVSFYGNQCINEAAMNKDQIPALIRSLEENCPRSVIDTTTTPMESTTIEVETTTVEVATTTPMESTTIEAETTPEENETTTPLESTTIEPETTPEEDATTTPMETSTVENETTTGSCKTCTTTPSVNATTPRSETMTPEKSGA